jgi:probable rRNA maturation factor
MKHRVILTVQYRAPGCARLIKKAIIRTLNEENILPSCAVGVLITGPEEIRDLNREKRALDRYTDVLSFPAAQLVPGVQPEAGVFDSGRYVYLGDIAINIEAAKQQASEYGHELKREIAYLAVHSTLHLLGYDHMDEGEQKRLMRSREEAIMSSLSLKR